MTRAPITTAEPLGYVLYHRTGASGSRWAKVLETVHYAEGVARMRGPGDWWIAEVRDPAELRRETLQPSLFD